VNATRQGEEEVFAAARELKGPGERKAFLDDRCKDDLELRLRVDELLSVEAEAEQFFTEGRLALSLSGSAAPASWSSSTASDAVPPVPSDEESAGTRIGRYKLIQRIGEGGCGVVYMAEQ
jgi:eukaryotic-like serine/threonine-protein kinase